MELVDRQADLARVTGVAKLGEHRAEVAGVAMPDAVGHQLVEAEAQRRGPFRDRDEKLDVKEWFATREAQHLDAGRVSLFEKAERNGDVEAVGPFDRHAAMWTGQVALVDRSQH